MTREMSRSELRLRVLEVFLRESAKRNTKFRLGVRAKQFAEVGLSEEQVREGARLLERKYLQKLPQMQYSLTAEGELLVDLSDEQLRARLGLRGEEKEREPAELPQEHETELKVPSPVEAKSPSEQSQAPAPDGYVPRSETTDLRRQRIPWKVLPVTLVAASLIGGGLYFFSMEHSTEAERTHVDTNNAALSGKPQPVEGADCDNAKTPVGAYTCCIRDVLANYPEKVTSSQLLDFEKKAGLKAQGVEGKLGSASDVEHTLDAVFGGKPDPVLKNEIRKDCKEIIFRQFPDPSDPSDESPRPTPPGPAPPSKPKATKKKSAGAIPSKPTPNYTCVYEVTGSGTAKKSIQAEDLSQANALCLEVCENEFKQDCKLATK